MSTLWKKTLLYLGLVDDEEVEQAAASQAQVRTVRQPQPRGHVPGRRVEPPAAARRRISGEPSHAEAGVLVHSSGSASVRQIPAGESEADVIVAREFNDAQLLADRIRARTPVVLDLRETDPEMVRRLVDFASGLTYALEGSMRKISQGVILVLPPRVALGREERERLAGLGLYDLGED